METNFYEDSNRFSILDRCLTYHTTALPLGKLPRFIIIRHTSIYLKSYLPFVTKYFFQHSLQAYKHLAPLRLLVCGGDGSVGWVLKEIDKLHMKVRLQNLKNATTIKDKGVKTNSRITWAIFSDITKHKNQQTKVVSLIIQSMVENVFILATACLDIKIVVGYILSLSYSLLRAVSVAQLTRTLHRGDELFLVCR